MTIQRLAIVITLLFGETHAQEYTADPLLIGAGARSLGMGSAFVAVSDDATALYWNAAGLTQLSRNEIQAQHAEQFGGTVNHDFIVAGIRSTLGTFGLGIVRLGVDGITLSGLEDPTQPLSPGNRPVATGATGTSDYVLSIGYSRQIRPKLSVGTTLKAIWRNLDVGDGTGYGLDAAIHYRYDNHWQVGAVIRDLTRTRITFDSGARDSIQPSLNVGAAYKTKIASLKGRIMIASSFVLNQDTSEAEDAQLLRTGLEYRHNKGLSGRLGLEGDHFTAGAGLEPSGRFRVDVAFLENGDLDNTYRISASLYF